MTQQTQPSPVESVRRPAVKTGLWILLGICLMTAIVSRVGFLGYPFQRDAELYAEMGRVVAEGKILYQEFFETKLPTVGALVAPFWKVFGAYWPGYVLTQLAGAVLAAFVLAWAARRYIGGYTFWPMLLFGLVYFNLTPLVLTGFQLETLMVVFSGIGAAFALAALSGGRGMGGMGAAFAVGILAGLAAMAKPTGLAVAGAMGVALLFRVRDDGWRLVLSQLAALSLGVLIVIAANVVWIVNSPMWQYMPEIMHQIRLYGSQTPWWLMVAVKVPIFIGIPLFPLAVRGLTQWRRQRRTTASGRQMPEVPGASRAVWAFVLTWWILEFIGVVIQKRPYSYHYLTLVTPAALIYGILPFRPRFWPIAAGLTPAILVSLYYSIPMLRWIDRGFEESPVSLYLKAHTNPEDTIWGDYNTRLLLETGLWSGSRIATIFYFVNSDEAPGLFGGMLLSDFEMRKPKYIVLSGVQDRAVLTTANDRMMSRLPLRRERFLAEWERVKAYIHQHYKLEAKVDGQEIYRRQPPQ